MRQAIKKPYLLFRILSKKPKKVKLPERKREEKKRIEGKEEI